MDDDDHVKYDDEVMLLDTSRPPIRPLMLLLVLLLTLPVRGYCGCQCYDQQKHAL